MLTDIKKIVHALVRGHVRTLFTIRLFRMGLVGLSGFFVQATLFELLALQFSLVRPSTATLIGAEGGIILAFFLHNRFTFSDKPLTSLPTLLSKFPQFNLGVAGSLVIQWLTVRIAEVVVGDVAMLLRLANVLGVCLGFTSNYLLYTRIIWRKEQGPLGEP